MRKLFFAFGLLLSLTSYSQDSLNIKMLYHWKVDSFPISSAHSNAYNEVWGFVQNGKEYGVIGSTLGTHIFDVTNPANAQEVVYIPGKHQGPSIVHRDYHDYNGYLYMVCDEGASSLQIADLSFLPDSAPLVYDSDALFRNSHNIFIDTTSAKMYVCGGENHFNVYSLANPANPTLLLNCSTDVSFWESTIGYIHDVYVRNDTAYCNAGSKGLFIVDFTNTQNTELIGSVTQYPYKGYNHSGWLSDDGNVYALADEDHGFDIKLFDVSDVTEIDLLDTIDNGIDSLSIPHNLIFHGDHLYVSYYHDGLYIWNTKNPEGSYISGFYDTSTENHTGNYRGNWGVYPFLPSGIVLASDMQNGFYIFDVTDAVSSIENLEATNNLVVFPNPSAHTFNFSIPTPQDYSNYTVIDVTGSEVTAGTINGTITTISLPSGTSNGIYFLQLTGEKRKLTKQLIKAY